MCAGHEHLETYAVSWQHIGQEEIDSFKQALDAAGSERELQVFLELYPRFLVQHLPAREQYFVIPQARLGSEYVTDFLLAEPEGSVLNWFAVELERPQAKLFTARGDPSAVLTHALGQIDDWRHWLAHNGGYARRSPEEAGLGLTGVDAELEGLIVLGRDSEVKPAHEARRSRLARAHRVRIQTFDWLVQQAEERERAVKRNRPRSWPFSPPKKRPADYITKALGGRGFASMQVSATRTIDWDMVGIRIDDEFELSAAFASANVYGAYDRREEFTRSDWEDWLGQVEDDFDEQHSLVITEKPVAFDITDSLFRYSEDVYYELSQPTRSEAKLDILVSVSTDQPEDECVATANLIIALARRTLEDYPSTAKRRYRYVEDEDNPPPF